MKTLLCFLLSALCLSAHGQAVLRSAVLQSFSQTSSSAQSCSVWGNRTNLTANDYDGVSVYFAQKIKNDSGAKVSVCQADFYLENNTGGARSFVCSLWSTADKTGTQYGADSQAEVLSATTTAWVVFQWSSNPEVPAMTDVYLHVNGDGAFVVREGNDDPSGTYYENTDYAITWDGTTTSTKRDAVFRLYRLQ